MFSWMHKIWYIVADIYIVQDLCIEVKYLLGSVQG